MAKKNKTKVKQKPIATKEQIQNIVDRYNRFNKGNTPEQIYNERDAIHREMSKYSNADEIYREIVKDRDTSPDGESYVIIPKEAGVFPGYQPTYEESEYGDKYISEYEPIQESIVPEGAVAVTDDILMNDLVDDDVYSPNFRDSYMYYYYPKIQEPEASEDILEDEQDLTDDQSQVDKQNSSDNAQQTPYDYISNNYDLFGYQNAYYDKHGFFDHLDPEVAEVLDTYKLSPNQLQDILSSIYDITDEEEIVETPEEQNISSQDYNPKVQNNLIEEPTYSNNPSSTVTLKDLPELIFNKKQPTSDYNQSASNNQESSVDDSEDSIFTTNETAELNNTANSESSYDPNAYLDLIPKVNDPYFDYIDDSPNYNLSDRHFIGSSLSAQEKIAKDFADTGSPLFTPTDYNDPNARETFNSLVQEGAYIPLNWRFNVNRSQLEEEYLDALYNDQQELAEELKKRIEEERRNKAIEFLRSIGRLK